MDEQNPEIGYQYINTTFTGSVCPQLSGNSDFPIVCSDNGTSAKTENFELKSYFI
jgi:hypothetical protein